MSENQNALARFVTENARLLAVLTLGYVALVETGNAEYPTPPEGSGLLVLAAVVVGGVGYVSAGQIYGLLPDEEGIFLVAFDASEEAGGSVWELSEDQFEQMEVYAGSLFQWPTSKRVYEVREYDPGENKAVANWRESVPGSELAGNTQVVDVLEQIAELRDEFEPEAQRFRLVKRRLRSVARRMDRRRDRDQQAILDPHLTPDFGGDEGATVSDVLDEEMPDHLLPNSMQADEQTDDHSGESGEFAGFELLDDAGGLDPEPEVMANDD